MRIVPGHRIPGMVTYPLDEILVSTLVGVVCGADDWEAVEEVTSWARDWLRRFLPFAHGIANSLHWCMDVIFGDDRRRTRKDSSPLNFAIICHAAFNIIEAGKTRGALRRERLRACIGPGFRTNLFGA